MKKEFALKFQKLPRSVQMEILNYVEELISKYMKTSAPKKKKQSFSFSWENGLSDMKNKFTSVELQHRANQLR